MKEPPTYPHHSWTDVSAFYTEIAATNAQVGPMRDFVVQLARSRYADALYPMQSMQTLILSLHEQVHQYQDRVSVDYEEGEFVVRYQGGPTAAVWTARRPDGMAALERFFHHVGWFPQQVAAGSDHETAD